MKHLPALLIIPLIFCNIVYAQETPEYATYKGWEFLRWGTSILKVEQTLQSRGIEFETRHDVDRDRTHFTYDGITTIISYDGPAMEQVDQFLHSETQESGEDPKDLFEQTFHQFRRKYGKGFTLYQDRERKVKTYTWLLKYTEVNLHYFYDEGEVHAHFGMK